MSPGVLAVLFAVHLLAAVTWIGGLAMLALEPERRRLQILSAANRPDHAASEHVTRRRSRLAELNLVCGLLTLLFTAVATAQ